MLVAPNISPTHLDVDLSLLDLDQSATPEMLGQGFNSLAVRVDDVVVKIGKSLLSAGNAEATAQTYRTEHEQQARFIGDYMVDTQYALTPSIGSRGMVRLVTVQPLVPGQTIAEHLADPAPETESLLDFLKQCQVMFSQTGQIPDLANIETGFSIFRNSNVVMRGNDPVLVDVNYGKTQRSLLLGPVWSRAIAHGVAQGVQQISNGTYRNAIRPQSAVDRLKRILPLPDFPIGSI